jgi:hypothetical protein
MYTALMHQKTPLKLVIGEFSGRESNLSKSRHFLAQEKNATTRGERMTTLTN